MRIARGRSAGDAAKSLLPLRAIRRLYAPLALATAGVLALSGCGVEVVGSTPSPGPSVAAPLASSVPAESETPAVVDVDPSASPEPSATEAAEPTEKDRARRSYYADEIDLTTGCPTGRVTIDQSMRVTRITEDCDQVIVTAAFTTLLAEHIGTLTIKNTASHGHFVIGSIGKATVAAPFNHVYWDSGRPVLNVTGFKCVVEPNPAKETK